MEHQPILLPYTPVVEADNKERIERCLRMAETAEQITLEDLSLEDFKSTLSFLEYNANITDALEVVSIASDLYPEDLSIKLKYAHLLLDNLTEKDEMTLDMVARMKEDIYAQVLKNYGEPVDAVPSLETDRLTSSFDKEITMLRAYLLNFKLSVYRQSGRGLDLAPIIGLMLRLSEENLAAEILRQCVRIAFRFSTEEVTVKLIQEYFALVSNDAFTIEAMDYLGSYFSKKQDVEPLKSIVTTALQGAPYSDALYHAAAEVFASLQRFDEAVEYLRNLCAIRSEDLNSNLNLFRLASLNGNFKSAHQTLELITPQLDDILLGMLRLVLHRMEENDKEDFYGDPEEIEQVIQQLNKPEAAHPEIPLFLIKQMENERSFLEFLQQALKEKRYDALRKTLEVARIFFIFWGPVEAFITAFKYDSEGKEAARNYFKERTTNIQDWLFARQYYFFLKEMSEGNSRYAHIMTPEFEQLFKRLIPHDFYCIER